MFVSPVRKERKTMRQTSGPSTLEYKDPAKKFSTAHTVESFLVFMYNMLSQEGNSISDVLIDPEFSIPVVPEGSPPEVVRDHAKYFGTYVVSNNVKSLVSILYDKMSEDYQQKISSQYPNNTWRTVNSIPQAKEFIKFVKRFKVEEKGAKRSTILEIKKAMVNARQLDYEDAAQYIVRMNRLKSQEAELVANPTPEQEFVGLIINGLRSGYNPLTNSWALDEIRGDVENAGPTTIEELSTALRKFESSKPFRGATKTQSPSNFLTDQPRGNSPNKRVRGKLKCFTCDLAGRKSNHDFRSCKHSIKWRDANSKRTNDKGEDKSQEVALVTNKKNRRAVVEEDDYYDEPTDHVSPQQSDNEDPDPKTVRTVRVKRKKRGGQNP